MRSNVEEGVPVWQGPVAGAVAGVLSRIVVFPSDTVKVRMQLQGTGSAPPLYNSTLHAFKTILGREGLGGFYRGFSAIAFGVIPANMTYFGGYELAKRVVPEAWGLRRDMAVGAVAQLAAGVVFTPIDVIKERMQVQGIMGGRFAYSSSLQALKGALAHAGVAGLFRGYWATNAVWLPWNIVYICTYERLKRLAATATAQYGGVLRAAAEPQATQASPSSAGIGGADGAEQPSTSGRHHGGAHGSQHSSSLHGSGEQRGSGGHQSSSSSHSHTSSRHHHLELSPWAIAACSASSAGFAALLTHPVDVVKTRLQVLSGTPEGRGLTSLQVAKRLLEAEGAGALMKGASARILSIAPGSALSWALYEAIKPRLLAATT